MSSILIQSGKRSSADPARAGFVINVSAWDLPQLRGDLGVLVEVAPSIAAISAFAEGLPDPSYTVPSRLQVQHATIPVLNAIESLDRGRSVSRVVRAVATIWHLLREPEDLTAAAVRFSLDGGLSELRLLAELHGETAPLSAAHQALAKITKVMFNNDASVEIRKADALALVSELTVMPGFDGPVRDLRVELAETLGLPDTRVSVVGREVTVTVDLHDADRLAAELADLCAGQPPGSLPLTEHLRDALVQAPPQVQPLSLDDRRALDTAVAAASHTVLDAELSASLAAIRAVVRNRSALRSGTTGNAQAALFEVATAAHQQIQDRGGRVSPELAAVDQSLQSLLRNPERSVSLDRGLATGVALEVNHVLRGFRERPPGPDYLCALLRSALPEVDSRKSAVVIVAQAFPHGIGRSAHPASLNTRPTAPRRGPGPEIGG